MQHEEGSAGKAISDSESDDSIDEDQFASLRRCNVRKVSLNSLVRLRVEWIHGGLADSLRAACSRS